MDPRQSDTLLPKLALLAVALSQPDLKHIAAIVSGATDQQNVARAEQVFCYPAYIAAAVNTAGYPQSALVLTVLGRAYKAADASRLSLEDRSIRFHERLLLISQASLQSSVKLNSVEQCCFALQYLCGAAALPIVLSTWSPGYMSEIECGCK